MFRSFFLNRKWAAWSILGTLLIVGATWYQVQIDVQINVWFGTFYDTIQEVLTKPGSVTFNEFLSLCLDFAKLAAIFIAIAVLMEFFVRHYVFRWRTAMNEYYTQHWHKLRHIEGASQRIQEDTMRFARIVESLGAALLDSILTLAAFLPLLWGLTANITELPWIGHVPHAMVYLAILSAVVGTVLLALVGIKLPGLEFNNQRVEAAYRKELVLGEDDPSRATPPTLADLYTNVRKNYFTMYLHYLYFDMAKYSYLQAAVILPYIAMGPAIVAGAISFGLMQRILQAFSRVQASFQFLVRSWSTIVELISIYKRLRAFEKQITAP